MATTVVTKTIKASGGDYTSVSAFLAAIPADISAATGTEEQWIAEGYNDDFDGTGNNIGFVAESYTVSGITTDSSNNIIIRPASGEGHDGTFSNGGFGARESINSGAVVTVSNDHVIVQGIRIENYAGLTTSRCATGGYNYTVEWNGLVMKSAGEVMRNIVPNNVVRNCLAIDGDVGFDQAFNSATKFSNCTAANCTTGFNSEGSTKFSILKNCVVYGATTSFAGTYSSSSTNNAADDGSTSTPPGLNPITTDIVSGDFIDAANDDYHIPSSSTLYGAGADLSGDFTNDIDGDTRSAWSIGIDDGSGSIAPHVMHHMRQMRD